MAIAAWGWTGASSWKRTRVLRKPSRRLNSAPLNTSSPLGPVTRAWRMRPEVEVSKGTDGGDTVDFNKGATQFLGLKGLAPIAHWTDLVEIGDASEIGKLTIPDFTTVLGTATTTTMEYGVNQPAAIEQHLAIGLGYSLAGRSRFRPDSLIHLARHSGLKIKKLTGTPLGHGIGASGNRLGPQRGQRPFGRHLTAHHTRQITFEANEINRLQAISPRHDP